MSQGSMTFCDIHRHSGLKTQKRASDLSLSPVRFCRSAYTLYGGAQLRSHYIFLVAVIAEGDVNLMVFPSTVPAYLVLPAVKVISAPRRRP